MNLGNFCRALPKLELHAHLNGSLSVDTLKKLYKMQNPNSEDSDKIFTSIKDFSSLGECFKVFDIAHSLAVTPEAVFHSTYDTVKEFKDDNVIYLELRSTPRVIQGKMTKEECVEAIIKAFEVCKIDFPSILLKLLISINRKQGYKAAQENIELAIDFIKKYPQYIVGLDLSGDPMTGSTFLELLEKARMAGLKIAIHCAEISNETETIDILEFKPDRLGHCTCIHPTLQGSNKIFNLLLKSKIPVELCLTSNVQCKTVPTYESHQFKYLFEAGHPICLGTDDKGVFHTSLSHEYEIASSTFGLEREQLIKLCLSSVQYAFATLEEKQAILCKIEKFAKEYNVIY
ncbi:adenosine deaminase-like protein isoform X1 [Bombus pyrosoma]|uniref:adenosine deaminase-like protein isoform X1 n=2 Tax=Bombus pyrosoma TaxID=396416 RepID=UPI001CB97066|nr:adenosine deaminase-like protein isoform X1 [Bombus pyrosoma]